MTMRVRFLRGTALGGIGNDAFPGDELTLPDDQARALIVAGRAILAEPAAPSAAPESSAPEAKPKRKAKA